MITQLITEYSKSECKNEFKVLVSSTLHFASTARVVNRGP